jgi:hypothetical protein
MVLEAEVRPAIYQRVVGTVNIASEFASDSTEELNQPAPKPE